MTDPQPSGIGAADLLAFAAAPTFAVMAMLTPALDGSTGTLCEAVPAALPLNGMVLMYLLMSAFHAAPWLRLCRGRRLVRRGDELVGRNGHGVRSRVAHRGLR